MSVVYINRETGDVLWQGELGIDTPDPVGIFIVDERQWAELHGEDS